MRRSARRFISSSRKSFHIPDGQCTAFYDALMTVLNEYMRGVEGRKTIVVFTDGVDNQLFGNLASRSRRRLPAIHESSIF